MSLSKFDLFYRRLVLTKFYTRGWGKPEELRRILETRSVIANREECVNFVDSLDCPVTVEKPVHGDDCTTINGQFLSPMYELMPDLVPEECKMSHFQLVLPSKTSKMQTKKIQTNSPMKEKFQRYNLRPMCVHMAGTGDHGFFRRRELIAKPLLNNSGIASLLLENPYYGIRKPKEQTRSGLLHVKDLFIMGGCLILEAQVLLRWLTQEGYGPLGLTGISMGGHMASLAATNWPHPIALVPCMSWTSSSVVWTEGVLSKAIPWRVLETQYSKDPAYETQINDIIRNNAVDSYELGKDYVKDEGRVIPRTSSGWNKLVKSTRERRAKKPKDDRERRQQQTLLFMKGVMDQMTHLQNFTVPIDPAVITFVVAKADAYYPLSSLRPMNEVWPGCEVRFLNTGHIAGFLIHHTDFCAAIIDTFNRLIEKHHMPKEDQSDEAVTVATSDSDAMPSNSGLVVRKGQDLGTHTPSTGASLYRSLKAFAIKS